MWWKYIGEIEGGLSYYEGSADSPNPNLEQSRVGSKAFITDTTAKALHLIQFTGKETDVCSVTGWITLM